MMNPMGRSHKGYMLANQSVLEEDERDDRGDDDDLEAGRNESPLFHNPPSSSTPRTQKSKTSRSPRKVSWNPSASELNSFRPNIQHQDKIQEEEESDDEVPQSFMIEAAEGTTPSRASKGKARETMKSAPINRPALNSVAGRRLPPSRSPTPTRVPKQASGVSIPPKPSEIDVDDSPHSTPSKAAFTADLPLHNRQTSQTGHLDDYEKAMWNWVNVYNLDGFLQEVYQYYEGNGIYSIALSRGLNLLTVGFVIGFSTFLLGCIDYSQFRHGDPTQLSHVIIDRCVSRFSGFTLLFFILFTAFYFWQIVSFALGVMRLVDMYNFYTHLLKIPDADIQTVSWPEIVRRIGAIREENPLTAISSRGSRKGNNPSTAKLDAHDIANRIMRQENYLIALFNKELLDLRVPMPNMLKRFIRPEEGKGKMLTQALEWNLRFCLMEYLFDQHGRVRKVFLKSKNRRPLIDGLRRRFIFMGILNAIFAPFIVLYLIMYSFFRYFEEYHKDPSSIGGRRYTSYARWKFREFNELPHVFKRRLDESYPIASIYIGQFPNDKITIIMRFVAFIAGSFAAVLALATLIDPDIFFHFEITPHRTVVFYLTVFGGILGAARGTIPEDNRVFDPELLMSEVITYTHYMPDEWKGLLHSKQIHQEFGELFAMKILIFMQELASVVLTPFILWYSLPECAPAIIDFFREFSVHVEGRGYVCSFAEFNFERHGNVKFGAPMQSRDKRMQSNEGKMEKSFLNFKAANPDWNPSDPTGSLYLNRIAGATNHIYGITRRRNRENAAAMEGQVHFAGEPKVHESSLAERAQEYDRALRQSQYGASSRRRIGASMLGASVMGAAGAPSASSIFGGYSQTAQTAVLGDSQGSINLDDRRKMPSVEDSLPGDELEVSGSGLDGSYVDGAKRTKPFDDNQEEDDAMQDGGVLGLLAQIYGRHDGQGPVRGGVL